MDMHNDPYGPYQLEAIAGIVRAPREKAVVAAASPLSAGSQKKNLGRRQLSPQQQNRRRLMKMDENDSITTAADPEQEESAPLDLTPLNRQDPLPSAGMST
jgi:LAS superfamily LD-carboxypeptidase LdcB